MFYACFDLYGFSFYTRIHYKVDLLLSVYSKTLHYITYISANRHLRVGEAVPPGISSWSGELVIQLPITVQAGAIWGFAYLHIFTFWIYFSIKALRIITPSYEYRLQVDLSQQRSWPVHISWSRHLADQCSSSVPNLESY